MSVGRQPPQRVLDQVPGRVLGPPPPPPAAADWRAPRPAAGAPGSGPQGRGRGRAAGGLLPLAVMLVLLLEPERSSCGPAGVALLCGRVAGLSPRQRSLCRSSPDAMVAIGTGLRLALQECQHQFQHERWNCSSAPHPHAHVDAHAMPLVVRVASREAAFSLAVQAAAISWAAASACARGELTGCSCARKPPGPGQHQPPPAPDQAFRWGGCSSDVEYGAKLSRTFTDASQPAAGAAPQDNGLSTPRRLMDRHNSKAGRKAVKLTLQTDCKCHGVSGSCSVRTCWTSLAPFRQVGDHLMARYRAAWPAVALPLPPPPGPPPGPRGPRARRHPAGLHLALRTARSSRAPAPRLPRRTDLVFLSGSPNYCDPDVALGSLGTAGRACNRTSRGADDCGVMCCGRGYNTRQVTRSQQCRCKFHWCCYVHCDVCTERYEEYTCK